MASKKDRGLEEENKQFIYAWLDKNTKKSEQPHTKIFTDPLFRDLKGKWIIVTGETGDISGKNVYCYNMEGVENQRVGPDGFKFRNETSLSFCREMMQTGISIHYTNEDYYDIDDKRFHFPKLKNTQQYLSSLVKDGIFYECEFNYPLLIKKDGSIDPSSFREDKHTTIFDLLKFLWEESIDTSNLSLKHLDKCQQDLKNKYIIKNKKGEDCGISEYLHETRDD